MVFVLVQFVGSSFSHLVLCSAGKSVFSLYIVTQHLTIFVSMYGLLDCSCCVPLMGKVLINSKGPRVCSYVNSQFHGGRTIYEWNHDNLIVYPEV